MKNLFNEIKKKLENSLEVRVIISIDCDNISLKNTHTLEIIKATETETVVEFETTNTLTFEIGKNYTETVFDEYENTYTFKYENGVVVSVTII